MLKRQYEQVDEAAEEVIKETKNSLDKMRDVPNYCLATGCEIPLETPYENIMAMVDTVKTYC